MKILGVVLACVVVAACRATIGDGAPLAAQPRGPLTAVPFDAVTIDDAFWKPRIETNRAVTVKACLDRCEETGRSANFARCAKLEPGEHEGALYNDSDVYKVLEGAAYTLRTAPDAALEARCDALIDTIAAAQQPDGYLNTYWTMVEPAKRWTNIAHGHELYCAGHLIEAAIAYAHATGKRKLLDVAVRFADHIDATFGPGRKLDPPGHPELELALVKLWRETNEARYLQLARFFVDQRGNADGRKLFGEYAQDHAPVREQRAIVGHAVRAMYLYCAMADIAGVTGERALWDALDALWRDVVETKMYVTGGIGSSAANEGFTEAYDLPNETAYCETCAAIGMALWNQRLFLASGDGKYADIVERELYNGFLSGVSTSGERFFYGNPLASRGGYERVPWFDCSCCPSNVVRFLPALGERIYAHRGDELYVSLYVASEATVPLEGGAVHVQQQTEYPWKGEVALRFDLGRPQEFELRLRVPSWCTGDVKVAVGGRDLDPGASRFEQGFIAIRRRWEPGDTVLLDLPMVPQRVYADARVKADVGRVAVMYGPQVYCAEGVDNGGSVRDLVLPREAVLRVAPAAGDSGAALRVVADGARSRGKRFDFALTEVGIPIGLVPYSTWANRGAGEMSVWLAETPAYAQPAGQAGELVGDVWVSASHCWRGDTLAALRDGVLPKSSSDESIPRLTFWDHRGTTEWVQYEFAVPQKLWIEGVYWFDDTGRGSCRVPKSWRVLFRRGEEWIEARRIGQDEYGTSPDVLNSVGLSIEETTAVRLEVELQPGYSAGILEWQHF